jgi:hypothetical protein
MTLTTKQDSEREIKATHPGKHGDHPLGGAVGAVVGATAGGAAAGAAKGAAIGSAAGIPGMIAGVAVGGVAGALAGKYAAQKINPTTEDEYWSKNYQFRTYVDKGTPYETYRPAYRHGVETYTRYSDTGRSFDEIEAQAAKDWEKARGNSPLSWEQARPASRDAFDRLSKRTVSEDDINHETGE